MNKKNNSDKNIFNPENKDSNRDDQLGFVVKAAKEQHSEEFFGLKWTLKAIFISFIFLGIIYYFAEAEKNPQLFSVNDVIKKTGLRSRWMTLTGNKNILFLGVDSNGRMSDPFFGTRSDTMIIVSIDKNGKSVNAVSIPRDSKVFLAKGQGVDKINSAHAIGGPELAIKTVEETFGIEINNYVVVNYKGIREFVKAVGGIPVNVEKRMYYRDRTAGLTIDLQPGEQVLNSGEVEGYLRWRHDANGDIGRIRRQQMFLKAALKTLQSSDSILKAPELIEILSENIKTDLNLFEISKLINIARNLDFEGIKVATLPGKPSKYGPISYWILDANKTQKIIDRLIYREKPKVANEELTISLFYSPEVSDKVDEIVDDIHSLGLNVKFRSKEENHYSQIIAHTKKAAFSRIDLLKEKVSELKNCQYVVEPDENLYPYTDFTIIIGDQ